MRRLEDGGSFTLPAIVPVRAGAERVRARTGSACSTTNDSVLRSVSRVPLFSGFLGLGALLLAIGSMWFREGR